MTDDHLRSTVRMLKRKNFQHSRVFMEALAYACSPDTPDGASEAMEAEIAWMRVNHRADAVFDEAERRGIT